MNDYAQQTLAFLADRIAVTEERLRLMKRRYVRTILYNAEPTGETLMQTPSLDATDATSKAVQKTPWRVSLEMMKQRVKDVEFIYPQSIPHMTICIVVLDNGYALQGMSAPADPENFNEEKGKEFAYEDAMRKLWPLEAYVMRDFLTGAVDIHDPNGRWNPTN